MPSSADATCGDGTWLKTHAVQLCSLQFCKCQRFGVHHTNLHVSSAKFSSNSLHPTATHSRVTERQEEISSCTTESNAALSSPMLEEEFAHSAKVAFTASAKALAPSSPMLLFLITSSLSDVLASSTSHDPNMEPHGSDTRRAAWAR